MAFTISPAVEIERGPGGEVRGLYHSGQPYGPIENVLNAKSLAEAYLRAVAPIYGIDPAWLNELDKTPSDSVEDVTTELRFTHQDAIAGTATVSFQQTYFGLPIWQ